MPPQRAVRLAARHDARARLHQDDGHIFCTEEQLQGECADFTALLQKVYRDFGFTEVLYKVATRPEKRIGSDEVGTRPNRR